MALAIWAAATVPQRGDEGWNQGGQEWSPQTFSWEKGLDLVID